MTVLEPAEAYFVTDNPATNERPAVIIIRTEYKYKIGV